MGGFFNFGIAIDTNKNGPGVFRDGEIYLNGVIETDRGVTFRTRVEVEATSSTDFIDEAYAIAETRWGDFKIGGDDSAKGRYQNGVIYAAGGRVGYYDHFTVVDDDAVGGARGGGDPVGVYYDSPDLSGFRFGLSYHPDADADGSSTATNRGDSNAPVFARDEQFGVGAVYEREWRDGGFGVSAGWLKSDAAPTAWHVGGNFQYAGLTIAGIYEDDGSDEFAIGALYETGPWDFGAGMSIDYVGGDDDQVIGAWISYQLAPGLAATAGAEHHDTSAGNRAVGASFTIRALF